MTQFFYGHGKLLLSSEYFILDGAKALAVPTQSGQSMSVKYKDVASEPTLYWKSFDSTEKIWLDQEINLSDFSLKSEIDEESKNLQNVLIKARCLNSQFLQIQKNVYVETRAEFPLNWGLGSSSTFIYNIAKWAEIDEFKLLDLTLGGSGYDLACAQSIGPIVYQRNGIKNEWTQQSFSPPFKDHLFFLYLGKKESTAQAIKYYNSLTIDNKEKVIVELSQITDEFISCLKLEAFEELIIRHNRLVADSLHLKTLKERFFQDYWGQVKQLGAWGGDFALVTSSQDYLSTKEYFKNKGFETFMTFDEMVLNVK